MVIRQMKYNTPTNVPLGYCPSDLKPIRMMSYFHMLAHVYQLIMLHPSQDGSWYIFYREMCVDISCVRYNTAKVISSYYN